MFVNYRQVADAILVRYTLSKQFLLFLTIHYNNYFFWQHTAAASKLKYACLNTQKCLVSTAQRSIFGTSPSNYKKKYLYFKFWSETHKNVRMSYNKQVLKIRLKKMLYLRSGKVKLYNSNLIANVVFQPWLWRNYAPPANIDKCFWKDPVFYSKNIFHLLKNFYNKIYLSLFKNRFQK